MTDGLFGKKDTVQDFALVVNFRFRRVDVLGLFGVFGHDPPSECDGFACQVVDGKHDPIAEKVALVLSHQTQFFQQLGIVAAQFACPQQGVHIVLGKAQSKFLDGFFPKSALLEIRQANVAAFVGIEKLGLKKFLGKLIDQVQAINSLLFLALLV